MNDLDKAILHLKIAAQDTSDRALVAYYKPGDEFYLDTLRESVERLEKALNEYHKAKEATNV